MEHTLVWKGREIVRANIKNPGQRQRVAELDKILNSKRFIPNGRFERYCYCPNGDGHSCGGVEVELIPKGKHVPAYSRTERMLAAIELGDLYRESSDRIVRERAGESLGYSSSWIEIREDPVEGLKEVLITIAKMFFWHILPWFVALIFFWILLRWFM